MDTVTLKLEDRDTSVRAKDYLSQGQIPVEYYGKGVDNRSMKVDYQTFRRLYNKAGGNTIVEVEVNGKDKFNALIHNVDYHPVTDTIMHAELINVRMDQEIHTQVPLNFVGIAPAVKEMGGILTTNTMEIEVKCLPKDLIHEVEVDISGLVDFHSFIRIEDLNVPKTVEVLNQPDDVVATCVAPRVEEEPEPAAAGADNEGGEAAEGDASAEGGDEGAKEE